MRSRTVYTIFLTFLIAIQYPVIAFAETSRVCFLCNKLQWSSMSLDVKHGFVMGAIATQTALLSRRPPETRSYLLDIHSCVTELGMKPRDMVDLVDSMYEDVELWDYSPDDILATGLSLVCKNKIQEYQNRRRTEAK